MPSFTIVRLLSLIVVGLLLKRLDFSMYASLFYAVLFGHYVMALIFSNKNLIEISKPGLFWLPVLLLLSYLVVKFQMPNILIFFGLHHALTDTFTLDRRYGGSRTQRYSRLSLNFFCYLYILKHQPEVFGLQITDYLMPVILGSYLVFLGTLIKKKWSSGSIDLIAFETLGLAFTIFSTQLGLTLTDLIFYHLVYWFIVPLGQSFAKGFKPTLEYVCMTALLTLIFFYFTPNGFLPQLPTHAQWKSFSEFFGYLHICSSFLVSKLNPTWIVNRFYSEQAA